MSQNSIARQIDERQINLAGYEILEDSDQPGFFLWVRREHGQIVGGCDTSLDSRDAIVAELQGMMAEVLQEEANIPAEIWSTMSADEKDALILEQFC